MASAEAPSKRRISASAGPGRRRSTARSAPSSSRPRRCWSSSKSSSSPPACSRATSSGSRWSGPTNWRRSCSCGSRCSVRSSPTGAANTSACRSSCGAARRAASRARNDRVGRHGDLRARAVAGQHHVLQTRADRPTPALGIPRSDVVLAVIVGLALILVLALLRLSEGDPKVVAAAVAGAVILSAIALVRPRLFAGAREREPRHLLRFAGRRVRRDRDSDRVRLRRRNAELSRRHDLGAAQHGRRADERGRLEHRLARRPAVHLSRLADGARPGSRAGWSRRSRVWSGTSAAVFRSCSSRRCIWFPASPARRSPTWRRSRRCSFPTWSGAVRSAAR